MSTDDEKRDLPVLQVNDQELPVLVPGTRPRHERARVDAHPGWFNLANQRHIQGLAVNQTRKEVWLATGGGVLHWVPELNCFTRYGSEHGLPGNRTTAVAIDGNGLIWVAHESFGISYLDGNIWRPYSALDKTTVSCLNRDDSGCIWAGSEFGVYAVTNPAESPTVELPPFGEPPRAMTVMNQDDVWLCSARGVFHFEKGIWARHNVQPNVLTLLRKDEYLWLGTLGALVRVNLITGEVYQSETWPIGEVTALTPTAAGVWMAIGGEVGLATETNWIPISRQRLNVRVTSLAETEDDNLWIGTHDGLLHGDSTGIHFRLTDAPPDVIGPPDTSRPPAPLSNMIQALAVQQLGTDSALWIGTANGLFRLDILTETWKHFSGIRDVRSLVPSTTNNELWIASWSSGLCCLKDQSLQKAVSDISHPMLTLVGGEGSLRWAAGLDGLYQSVGLSWTLVIPTSKLSEQGWLLAVTQAQMERVWLGTSTGLFAYHPSTDALLMADDIPGNPDIRSLLSISNGESEYIWVGTNHGLYCGLAGNLQLVASMKGQRVSTLAWDNKTNTLWVGTMQGLFQLVKKGNEWNTVSTFTSRNSGLAADKVMALALSISESGESMLWIGTSCGLSCYNYSLGRRSSNARN